MQGNLGKLQVFLEVDLRNFKTQLDSAKAGLRGLEQRMKQSAETFKMAGRQMMILGAALSGAAIAMGKIAIDFETSMAKVNTMLSKSTRHLLPEFSRQIEMLSKKWGQTTKVLGEGLYDVLSAQIDVSDAMGLMEQASIAATGGFTQVNTAVSALITLMTTYGKELKGTADAADWLAAVVERGRVTFEDVAGTIGQTAAMAAQAGMTIEDYGAAFAMLTRGGLDAHKAQTALRGILRSVLKVQEGASEAARNLGFEWNVDVIRAGRFEKTLRTLSDAQIEQLAAISPNIRGLLGWAIAAGQANKAGEDLEVMTNRAGKAMDKAQIAMATTAFQLSQIREESVAILRELGAGILPLLKDDLIPILKEWSEKISELLKKNKNISTTLVKLLAVVGPLTFAVGLLTFAFGSLFSLLGGPALIAMGAFIALVTSAIVWSDKWKLAANAIGIALINIDKLFLKLVETYIQFERVTNPAAWFGPFKQKLIELETWVKEEKESLDEILKGLQDNITEIYLKKEGISEAVGDAKDDLSDELAQLGMIDPFKPPEFEETIKGMSERFGDLKKVSDKTYRGMAEGFKSAFSDVLKGELTSLEDFFNRIWLNIQSSFADAISNMLMNWLFFEHQVGGSSSPGIGGLVGSLLSSFFNPASSAAAAQGVSNSTTAAIGASMGYQHGTDYVPSTGIYKLHEGEKIVPRESAGGASGGLTIINMISPGFIGEAIKQTPDMVINPITENILNRGIIRKVIKQET